MRNVVILLTGAAVLALVNYSIYEKEQLLADGRVVFLELAPVDPRSLMQGDYMALRFSLQNALPSSAYAHDGYLVAALDNRGVAAFRRLDNGLPLVSDELKLYYRVRGHQIRLGTNAFFFQEGTQDDYAHARYGEARVDRDGQILLTGLYDATLQRLGPPYTRPYLPEPVRFPRQ